MQDKGFDKTSANKTKNPPLCLQSTRVARRASAKQGIFTQKFL
nr:MAG TPA: hypothetical protein [Caudoviricetes sp.]